MLSVCCLAKVSSMFLYAIIQINSVQHDTYSFQLDSLIYSLGSFEVPFLEISACCLAKVSSIFLYAIIQISSVQHDTYPFQLDSMRYSLGSFGVPFLEISNLTRDLNN